MNNDEPLFSNRAARDEDTRAEALGLPDAGIIAALDEDSASDRHARLCFVIEASFTEYERRFAEAPETLTPAPGYVAQTPGTYGADVTPCFLQVMNEIMARYGAPVVMVH